MDEDSLLDEQIDEQEAWQIIEFLDDECED
jgi:hypothetical protein